MANILHLGAKELRSLIRDPMLLVLIAYSFTVAVYTASTAMPETLNKAPIGIVDQDRSPLSTRIVDAFYPPHFLLLVMPVTPFEIMTSKVLAMGLVVLAASGLSLLLVVRGLLAVSLEGSMALFLAGTALHLFATTSMGIFLATIGRSMPQFGLLLMLVLLPLQMLSGGATPRESMPEFVQVVMQAAPTTHFVMLAQAILFRGAGLSVIWPQFIALAVIGATLFFLSLARFRRTIGAMT